MLPPHESAQEPAKGRHGAISFDNEISALQARNGIVAQRLTVYDKRHKGFLLSFAAIGPQLGALGAHIRVPVQRHLHPVIIEAGCGAARLCQRLLLSQQRAGVLQQGGVPVRIADDECDISLIKDGLLSRGLALDEKPRLVRRQRGDIARAAHE